MEEKGGVRSFLLLLTRHSYGTPQKKTFFKFKYVTESEETVSKPGQGPQSDMFGFIEGFILESLRIKEYALKSSNPIPCVKGFVTFWVLFELSWKIL